MATASARFETKKRITFFFFFYRRRYGTDKIIWCYSEPLKWLLLHGGDKGDGEVSVSEAYARLRATVIFANEKRSKKSFGFESKQLFFRIKVFSSKGNAAPRRGEIHPPPRRAVVGVSGANGSTATPCSLTPGPRITRSVSRRKFKFLRPRTRRKRRTRAPRGRWMVNLIFLRRATPRQQRSFPRNKSAAPSSKTLSETRSETNRCREPGTTHHTASSD